MGREEGGVVIKQLLQLIGIEYGERIPPNDPTTLHRVAIIDGSGSETTIGLYWADGDGELVSEIEWPPSWPEWAVEGKGCRVVRI